MGRVFPPERDPAKSGKILPISIKGKNDGKNSVYSGNYIAPVEHTTYRKGYKTKIFGRYKHTLGIRSVGMFFADGPGRLSFL